MRIIAGEFGGRRLKVPAGQDTRPTADRVREALFSMLTPDVPGARVLDLFAGSGALSLEAISRGADFAVMCEKDRRAWSVIDENVQALGVSAKIRVCKADAMDTAGQLGQQGERFDLIFLDPPYHEGLLEEAMARVVPLLSHNGKLIAETAAGDMPKEAYGEATLQTSRKYGDCRISVYRKTQTKDG